MQSAEDGQSLRRARYLTITLGSLHAILFLISLWLLSAGPGPKATAAQLVRFYHSGAQRRLLLAGLYLMPFAGIAFIWFIVAQRMWIRGRLRQENVLLLDVQLVSGILYVALFFATAAASAVTAAAVEFSDTPIDLNAAREFPEFGYALMYVFAMRMAAMFVFTTSKFGQEAGVLPRWFKYIGYAVGLFLLLSATFNTILAVVFPLWVLALCALLLRRA
jgi:hypothetical protein